MQEATFCDWLINRGVQFHPDTVVVDGSSIWEWALDHAPLEKDYASRIGKSLPIFPNIFIGYKASEFPGNYLGAYMINSNLMISDLQIYMIIMFHSIRSRRGQLLTISKGTGLLFFNPAGYNELDEPNGVEKLILKHFPNWYSNVLLSMAEPLSGKFAGFIEATMRGLLVDVVIFTLAAFHKQHEIELIDVPHPKARRILRQTGKLPSPYFRILDASDRPQKRYAGSGQATGRTLEKPHIVRGHFRYTENHPLEQFNGTFWIPSHMKGKGDNAPPPRYKIVLRGDNAKTE